MLTEDQASRCKDIELIGKIKDRYAKKYPKVDHFGLFLDLSHAHIEIPLDLEELLESEDEEFFHDVSGIKANINRKTKLLENGFIPRFSINN